MISYVRRTAHERRGRPYYPFLVLLVLLVPAVLHAQTTKLRLGAIYFFGAEGLDLGRVRAALPIRTGAGISLETWPEMKRRLQEAVRGVTGKPPTDVAAVCCDEHGDLLIYVGLAGRSYHPFAFRSAPKGDVRLPAAALTLHTQMEQAVQEAVLKRQAVEDDTQGYAQITYPPARAKQQAARAYALEHGVLLRRVLLMSSRVKHRRAAATLVGYARQSRGQIEALVQAARDPDEEVRNAATRALGVLAQSSPVTAAKIPSAPFIAMLSSGTWTDRNKAGMVLGALTAPRAPKLLARLRADSLTSLFEMARWDAGHAGTALTIVGRIGGIPETRLQALMAAHRTEPILASVQR